MQDGNSVIAKYNIAAQLDADYDKAMQSAYDEVTGYIQPHIDEIKKQVELTAGYFGVDKDELLKELVNDKFFIKVTE